MSIEQTTTPDVAPERREEGRAELNRLRREMLVALGLDRRIGPRRAIEHARLMRADLEHLRAELARVRPVVDAARVLTGAWAANADGGDHARTLRSAVAALDGDAAATPQPAGESVSELTKRLADLLDVAVETEDWSLVEDAQGALHAAHGAAWAVSSAPPVDIPTRIRAAAHAAFTAMDKGVLMSETGDGAESVLAVGHLRLIAEYLERHPDWPSAQAIVRALATPTTDTPES